MLLALLVSMASFAQDFSGILGSVIDESGEPVIGATVVEKAKPQNATITNIDGQFAMKVSEGSTLVISYVGYQTQEVKAQNRMTVTLKEDAQVLNAREYMTIMNEAQINDGNAPRYTADFINNYSGPDTDWQEEVFNYNAPVVQHQVSISGGNDKMNYFLSLGYFDQEGIVGGNYDRSNYNRWSLRSNSTYTVFEANNRILTPSHGFPGAHQPGGYPEPAFSQLQ